MLPMVRVTDKISHRSIAYTDCLYGKGNTIFSVMEIILWLSEVSFRILQNDRLCNKKKMILWCVSELCFAVVLSTESLSKLWSGWIDLSTHARSPTGRQQNNISKLMRVCDSQIKTKQTSCDKSAPDLQNSRSSCASFKQFVWLLHLIGWKGWWRVKN